MTSPFFTSFFTTSQPCSSELLTVARRMISHHKNGCSSGTFNAEGLIFRLFPAQRTVFQPVLVCTQTTSLIWTEGEEGMRQEQVTEAWRNWWKETRYLATEEGSTRGNMNELDSLLFHTSSAVLMNVPLCRRWCTLPLCLDNSTVYLFSVQHIPPDMHSLQVIFHHFLITLVCSLAVFPLLDLLIY